MVEITRSKAQSCSGEEERQSRVHAWGVCNSFKQLVSCPANVLSHSWWISQLFAHRAGIVDSGSSEGGIVSDSAGAYAVIMTHGDEIPGSTPDTFQYRARDRDPGRYRLTAGTPESRHPIRILRSHSLRSFWKPRAGLRYDGLWVDLISSSTLRTYPSITVCALC